MSTVLNEYMMMMMMMMICRHSAMTFVFRLRWTLCIWIHNYCVCPRVSRFVKKSRSIVLYRRHTPLESHALCCLYAARIRQTRGIKQSTLAKYFVGVWELRQLAHLDRHPSIVTPHHIFVSIMQRLAL